MAPPEAATGAAISDPAWFELLEFWCLESSFISDMSSLSASEPSSPSFSWSDNAISSSPFPPNPAWLFNIPEGNNR